MFHEEEYVFKGKHAKYVIELKNALFNTNADILLLAPILGLVYNMKSSIDTSPEYSDLTTKVFSDKMIKCSEEIINNYRICMLLCDEISDNKRVEAAFKTYPMTRDENFNEEEYKKCIAIYNGYILGGVEVLYEIMLEGNKEYNGNVESEHYKNYIVSRITEYMSEYLDVINDYKEIYNELEEL